MPPWSSECGRLLFCVVLSHLKTFYRRSLVGASADVEAERDLDGLRPLHIVAARNHPHTARVLLRGGADPGQRCTYSGHHGCTAMHIAAALGHAGVAAEILREDGGAAEAVTPAGMTPLLLAADGGHIKVVML